MQLGPCHASADPSLQLTQPRIRHPSFCLCWWTCDMWSIRPGLQSLPRLCVTRPDVWLRSFTWASYLFCRILRKTACITVPVSVNWATVEAGTRCSLAVLECSTHASVDSLQMYERRVVLKSLSEGVSRPAEFDSGPLLPLGG